MESRKQKRESSAARLRRVEGATYHHTPNPISEETAIGTAIAIAMSTQRGRPLDLGLGRPLEALGAVAVLAFALSVVVGAEVSAAVATVAAWEGEALQYHSALTKYKTRNMVRRGGQARRSVMSSEVSKPNKKHPRQNNWHRNPLTGARCRRRFGASFCR
jgi:hypothetical protein